MQSHPSSASRRLFFALWPPDDIRRTIEGYRSPTLLQGSRSRYVPADKLHLTLHFVGNVNAETEQCMREVAGGVRVECFEIVIDSPGYFSEARVAWVGCCRIPESLLSLHAQLEAALLSCDFCPDARPYTPHITLARKVACEPPAAPIQPTPWLVNEFVLVESASTGSGVEYTVLQRFPLNA